MQILHINCGFPWAKRVNKKKKAFAVWFRNVFDRPHFEITPKWNKFKKLGRKKPPLASSQQSNRNALKTLRFANTIRFYWSYNKHHSAEGPKQLRIYSVSSLNAPITIAGARIVLNFWPGWSFEFDVSVWHAEPTVEQQMLGITF